MDYKTELETRLKDYRTRSISDDYIDEREPFVDLDWTQDNRAYFKALVENKIVTRKTVTDETNRARLRATLTKQLGSAPISPREYARAYAEREAIRITYKGAITVPGRSSASILDFARGARLRAAELGLAYSRDAINDAVEDYYCEVRDTALDTIKAKMEVRQGFDWIAMAKTCFDTRTIGAEFAAAVIKSFIWQVRRKLHGLPIPSPLMPVIQGLQEKGKSYFVKKLIEPYEELVSSSDFSAITDDRNIDLWRSFIIVLDEMSKCAKSDVEAIKHVVTAEYLERRPMRTNSSVTIRQLASFIGTTNPSLAEIMKDETGNRRFVEVRWNPDYVIGGVDRFDYSAAWGSVHQSDADPMAEFKELLKAVQADSRNHGPVEGWLMSLDDSDWTNISEHVEGGMIKSDDLYRNYLAHRDTVTGGFEPMHERRTMTAFAHELNRVTQNNPEYGFAKHRTSKANGWRLTNQPVLTRVGGTGQ